MAEGSEFTDFLSLFCELQVVFTPGSEFFMCLKFLLLWSIRQAWDDFHHF